MFLLLFAALLGQSAPVDPPVAITMTDNIAPSAVIGPIKAGLVCLPKGRLRWGDVAKPATGTLEADLERIFADATTAGGKLVTKARVTLVSATLRLCVAGLGIGERKPSGKGHIELTFAPLDAESTKAVDTRSVSVDFDVGGRDPRRDPAVIEDAVKNAGRLFAAHQ